MSLSCLKAGRKWCPGRPPTPPGKGKGRPGKAWEKGCMKPGKGGGGGGGPRGLCWAGGGVSPGWARLKGILGKREKGRRGGCGGGPGRDSRENRSEPEPAAAVACLQQGRLNSNYLDGFANTLRGP